MPWGAAIAAGAALIGSSMQSDAAGDASDAQSAASAAAIAEHRRQFDAIMANLQPYINAGTGALGGLERLSNGDYSAFYDSPDYKYARDQMVYGMDHSAAAQNRLFDGGYGVDLATHLNGLASQNLGNYRGSLQWLGNLGQNAAAGAGQAGQNSANAIGGYLTNQGDAQASAYLAQGNSQANMWNQLGQIGASYFGGR